MHGGYRPGSGRKRLTDKPRIAPLAVARQLADVLAAEVGQSMPQPPVMAAAPGGKVAKPRKFKDSLSYAMAVINDPTVTGDRKDRLAIAAMPFQHAKLAEKALGKKEQQALDAKTAGTGSDWDGLMATPSVPRLKVAA